MEIRTEGQVSEWDLVDEASAESFPASDPPAWGSAHAAPSAETIVDGHIEAIEPEPTHNRLRQIALALFAFGSLIAYIQRIRRHRAHA